jgi:hypothetical protein
MVIVECPTVGFWGRRPGQGGRSRRTARCRWSRCRRGGGPGTVSAGRWPPGHWRGPRDQTLRSAWRPSCRGLADAGEWTSRVTMGVSNGVISRPCSCERASASLSAQKASKSEGCSLAAAVVPQVLAGQVTEHEPRSSAPSAMRASALHPRAGSADEGQDLRQRGRGSVSWRRHREGAMSGPDLDSAGEVVVRHQPVDQA